MASKQELEGRKGRIITDQDARDIGRVEELSYDLKISETMTSEVASVSPDTPLGDVLEILHLKRWKTGGGCKP
jgi:signal-transduction protein with cAMP-binding, CBS, and nucleotidyltransferase domain